MLPFLLSSATRPESGLPSLRLRTSSVAGMESGGWERYRIQMASRIGDPNTSMGLDDAALQQRRAGSTKLMRRRLNSAPI